MSLSGSARTAPSGTETLQIGQARSQVLENASFSLDHHDGELTVTVPLNYMYQLESFLKKKSHVLCVFMCRHVHAMLCVCRSRDKLGCQSLSSSLRQGLLAALHSGLAGPQAPTDSLVSVSYLSVGH